MKTKGKGKCNVNRSVKQSEKSVYADFCHREYTVFCSTLEPSLVKICRQIARCTCRNVVLTLSHQFLEPVSGVCVMGLSSVWNTVICMHMLSILYSGGSKVRRDLPDNQVWLHSPVRHRDGDVYLHEPHQWRHHLCHGTSRLVFWYHWCQPQGTGTVSSWWLLVLSLFFIIIVHVETRVTLLQDMLQGHGTKINTVHVYILSLHSLAIQISTEYTMITEKWAKAYVEQVCYKIELKSDSLVARS